MWLKAFRAEVAERIFSQTTIQGWGFDIEVLVLARAANYRLELFPRIGSTTSEVMLDRPTTHEFLETPLGSEVICGPANTTRKGNQHGQEFRLLPDKLRRFVFR